MIVQGDIALKLISKQKGVIPKTLWGSHFWNNKDVYGMKRHQLSQHKHLGHLQGQRLGLLVKQHMLSSQPAYSQLPKPMASCLPQNCTVLEPGNTLMVS